jgi:hypothetical protein
MSSHRKTSAKPFQIQRNLIRFRLGKSKKQRFLCQKSVFAPIEVVVISMFAVEISAQLGG